VDQQTLVLVVAVVEEEAEIIEEMVEVTIESQPQEEAEVLDYLEEDLMVLVEQEQVQLQITHQVEQAAAADQEVPMEALDLLFLIHLHGQALEEVTVAGVVQVNINLIVVSILVYGVQVATVRSAQFVLSGQVIPVHSHQHVLAHHK
jgi:hypothetical protein